MKISKSEIHLVTYFDSKHNVKFIITSDKNKLSYFLYSISDKGEAIKIKQSSKSPEKLDEYASEQIKKEK